MIDKENAKPGINTNYIIMGTMLLIGACCTIVPSQITVIIVMCITSILCLRGNGVLMLPQLLFYYNYFGEIAGIRTFYICAILIVASDIKSVLRVKKDISLWLVVLVYFLYIVCVVSTLNIKSVIYMGISVITMVYARKKLLSNKELLRMFFMIFGLTAIISYFNGLFSQNIYDTVLVLAGHASSVARTMGTFNDPNYMGLYYSVAVFSMVSLELFDKRVRIIIVCALYVMIATTLSITAILGNILFWSIYLLLTKNINTKTFVIILIVTAICVGLYLYGLEHTNIPFLSDLSARISDKLQNAENMDSLTTGRSSHAKDHWNYYCKQNLWRMLIGGNCVNSLAIDPAIDTIAAHNEYVDLLLNVGFIGTFVLVLYLGKRLVQTYLDYRYNNNDKNALCVFMIKVVYVFYAATLTMFMENRFLLFYFL